MINKIKNKQAVVDTSATKNKYLEKIMDCVMALLGEEEVSIGLFGSIVVGKARRGSDVDVAIIPHGGWKKWKLSLLRERLENLNVPYKVELVDFSEVSDRFRKHALENVVWWKN